MRRIDCVAVGVADKFPADCVRCSNDLLADSYCYGNGRLIQERVVKLVGDDAV